MKTFQAVVFVFAALAACASAFSPQINKPTFTAPASIAEFKNVEASPVENKNAAALAAIATAMAPLAAQAADVDEGVVIGYGAGLVACVVSLAVGFSIGYGTLVKP
eukprot:CAMPEP_0195516156 /NCGR_PEP_ID=MMETSP0794_2-20130614/6964_1 /TAXON_ID=515487 /ORGANISM="Stephanopyxis turris, Strain CCMP 815" /LENGTH=105 /DNA_ID=CAMNT_0040644679 /DNA_START=68 /DNA_END=385 /DNA_ORIENTATION=+